MEPDWVKVRQAVAERVLNRHLEDLEQQEHAVEHARRRHARQTEWDMRSGQRLRAGSLHADATEPKIAPTRRRSLPSGPSRPDSPPAHSTRSPPRVGPLSTSPTQLRKSRGLAEGLNQAMDKPQRERSDRRAVTGDGESESVTDLLQLMRSTLEEARAVEERRPSLYLQPTLSPARLMAKRRHSEHSKLIEIDDSPILPTKDHPREGIPSLERGETFIETKEAQVLSLESDANEATMSEEGKTGLSSRKSSKISDTGAENPDNTTVTRKNSKPDPTNETESQPVSTKKPTRKPGNATVEFYDEEIGLAPAKDKDEPQQESLSLSLDKLKDIGDEDDASGDGGEKNNTLETPREGEGMWEEVKKCRYIRGYNPPEMLMPPETVSFVFGGK